jgi:precorrin-6B methylase 1
MMDRAILADFLIALADPAERARYFTDPERSMAEHAIPALARAAIRAGLPEWVEALALAEVEPLRPPASPLPDGAPAPAGGLTVVGTGMGVGQLTAEARTSIEMAPKLLYSVADPASERLLLTLNSNAESLQIHYREGAPRRDAYNAMVDRILACLGAYGEVCVALYGHPGVFVFAGHVAIARARAEGRPARMLPAVSSLDCLWADLGVDPAHGCVILEATDFVERQRPAVADVAFIILQIGATGDRRLPPGGVRGQGLPALTDLLLQSYPGTHPAIVYEAATLPIFAPRIVRTTIADLPRSSVSDRSTLYIPPLPAA